MRALWAKTTLAAVLLVSGMAAPAAGQSGTDDADTPKSVRMKLPNDFGVELLGRCILYNFSYQRMLIPMLGLEASVSGLGSGSTEGGESASLMFGSAGGRFYFMNKAASPFVTGGVVVLSASTDTGPFGSENATANYGYTGVGFEFRSPGGFLFRGTAYGLVASGGYFIWPGLTVGYAF
jgi:hypothetical protein